MLTDEQIEITVAVCIHEQSTAAFCEPWRQTACSDVDQRKSLKRRECAESALYRRLGASRDSHGHQASHLRNKRPQLGRSHEADTRWRQHCPSEGYRGSRGKSCSLNSRLCAWYTAARQDLDGDRVSLWGVVRPPAGQCTVGPQPAVVNCAGNESLREPRGTDGGLLRRRRGPDGQGQQRGGEQQAADHPYTPSRLFGFHLLSLLLVHTSELLRGPRQSVSLPYNRTPAQSDAWAGIVDDGSTRKRRNPQPCPGKSESKTVRFMTKRWGLVFVFSHYSADSAVVKS